MTESKAHFKIAVVNPCNSCLQTLAWSTMTSRTRITQRRRRERRRLTGTTRRERRPSKMGAVSKRRRVPRDVSSTYEINLLRFRVW